MVLIYKLSSENCDEFFIGHCKIPLSLRKAIYINDYKRFYGDKEVTKFNANYIVQYGNIKLELLENCEDNIKECIKVL